MKERVIKGLAVSEGISIGKAFLVSESEPVIHIEKRRVESTKHEISKYKEALRSVREELNLTKSKIVGVLGKAHSRLAEAYQLILEDPLFTRDVMKKIKVERISAESAVAETLERMSDYFSKVDDSYFKDRLSDIVEVGKHIIRCLIGIKKRSISDAEEGSIVIVHFVSPDDAYRLKERSIKAIISDSGTATSHLAIISKELNIPTVVGLKNISSYIKDGDMVIVDGNEGVVIVNPSEETIKKYEEKRENSIRVKDEIEKARTSPAETIDGYKIKILASVSSVDEIDQSMIPHIDGIGILRTEFLYLNTDKVPTENEQSEVYRWVAERFYPKPVSLRTADIGGDKLIKFGFLGDLISESNPFMGLRGLRFGLKYPAILCDQLRAILRASVFENIRLLFPMVTSVSEIIEVKKIINEIMDEFENNNIRFNKNLEIGIMVETPAVALSILDFVDKINFVSIGTNDLLQYTLAVDRSNENIANLYDPFHSSFLRILQWVVNSLQPTKVKIGVCGEMASDPLFIPILIGFGINEFSVALPMVAKVKSVIKKISYKESQKIVTQFLATQDKSALISSLKEMTA